MRPSRFDDLLRRWRDGDADAAELAELEHALLSDARRRRSLVRSIQLEVDLHARYAVLSGTRAAQASVRRRRWEAVAALLAVAVSLAAAAAFMLRGPDVPGRVASGVVRVDGAPARSFDLGASLESESATLRFGGGPEILLGGAGAFLKPDLFELRGGSARIKAPMKIRAGGVSLELREGELSLYAGAGGLEVSAERAIVDVDYDGFRHALNGERRRYLPLSTPDAKEAEKAEKRLKRAKLSLAEALGKVSERAGAASLEEEDGRVVVAVRVSRGGRARELLFDAVSGALVEDEDDEDEGPLAVGGALSLREAVLAARAALPGSAAIEAEIEKAGEIHVAEVELLLDGRLYEVGVNLESGRVTSIAR